MSVQSLEVGDLVIQLRMVCRRLSGSVFCFDCRTVNVALCDGIVQNRYLLWIFGKGHIAIFIIFELSYKRVNRDLVSRDSCRKSHGCLLCRTSMSTWCLSSIFAMYSHFNHERPSTLRDISVISALSEIFVSSPVKVVEPSSLVGSDGSIAAGRQFFLTFGDNRVSTSFFS